MARYEYFHPSDEKAPRGYWIQRAAVGLGLFAGILMGVFLALERQQGWAYAVILGSFFIAVVVRVATALRPRVVREIQAAQLERLRGHVPEAIAQGRALLRRGLLPYYRAQVLLVLGECAEMEGDFAEAARIFVRAEGTLRATRMNKMMRAQQLAIVAARRAFAHAACGELDRAEATLHTAGVRDGVPFAGALSSRAMLLVLARRGLKQQVLERLTMDAKLLRNALAFRDRALVAVLAAFAHGREIPHGAVDPTITPWITAAFPESASLLGGAP